ncbi:MAG: glycosyltransferase [Candidatus Omnitrophica bacterium]|nr:glycosyltransferase [Candidatus Omnitrophota bacterium]MBU0878463.1 glycosyltransferase [Candidatus Omnitrophota bacterium]MBU0896239.1 glycosyltransferase [Candidatus Omnitrophota bacterium]MBU1133408.1 glycosyltransferase [Candidatus Omnitrophota bacterium]MBU1810675.1 glycosyltransferase [Candidatus Omnitrophota bacterium]
MNKNPFFSVIIPTYNRKDFLKVAIDSVLCQTFENFELIIVDDGSTDGTENLVTNYKDIRINYIHQKHKGVSSARNKGITNAQGKFISFLDSDDRFRKEKLETTSRYIKKYPQYKIFHTEEIWYRNGKLLPQKIYHKKPLGLIFKNAVKLCCISPSTAVIKKDIFSQVGLFDEKLPACEDYEFWLRVTSQFPVFLIPEYLTVKEGGHPGQQSKKYPAMDKFRIYALKKILESGRLNKSNYAAALEEFRNKCSVYIKGAIKRGKIKEVALYKQLIPEFEKTSTNYA